MTPRCPFCERGLAAVDFDTGVCECGAMFDEDHDADLLRFEGGEVVELRAVNQESNHGGFPGP